MTKKYNTPELQVVHLNNSDIVTNSLPTTTSSSFSDINSVGSADRFRDDFDAGY